MKTILTIQGTEIKVETKIKFIVSEKNVNCRDYNYESTTKTEWVVNRKLMEQDCERWSDEVLFRHLKEGHEKYGQFTSKEMADVFCNALNNMTQKQLVELSQKDDYKTTIVL